MARPYVNNAGTMQNTNNATQPDAYARKMASCIAMLSSSVPAVREAAVCAIQRLADSGGIDLRDYQLTRRKSPTKNPWESGIFAEPYRSVQRIKEDNIRLQGEVADLQTRLKRADREQEKQQVKITRLEVKLAAKPTANAAAMAVRMTRMQRIINKQADRLAAAEALNKSLQNDIQGHEGALREVEETAKIEAESFALALAVQKEEYGRQVEENEAQAARIAELEAQLTAKPSAQPAPDNDQAERIAELEARIEHLEHPERHDILRPDILAALQTVKERVATVDLIADMGITASNPKGVQRRIAAIMRDLGWMRSNSIVSACGRRIRGYVRPGVVRTRRGRSPTVGKIAISFALSRSGTAINAVVGGACAGSPS